VSRSSSNIAFQLRKIIIHQYTTSFSLNYITEQPQLNNCPATNKTGTPIAQVVYNILNNESSLTKIESAFYSSEHTPLMISRVNFFVLVPNKTKKKNENPILKYLK